MEASHIISKFGGIRPLARLLGYPVSTVQNWETRNSIPKKHFQGIINVATREGIQIAVEELIGIKVTSCKKRKR